MRNLPPGFASSPFLSAGGTGEAPRNEGTSHMGGFSGAVAPVFKPISEESFRTGSLEVRPSGGGGSPFLSSGDARPLLTVGDILPQLPPEVARGNGAPPDQPVMISPSVMEAAMKDGSNAIPLFEVFRVCPALFQVPVSPADHRKVQLPRASKPSVEPAPMPAAEVSPSPFSFFSPQGAAPAPTPSPFTAMAGGMPEAAPRMPEPPAPASRPIGTLPPRRPDGVPPAIPTQSDFSAVPTLHLPGAPVVAPSASPENPFAMAFSAQPTSPSASNFVAPPKHEHHQGPAFGAAEPSPFLAMTQPPSPAASAPQPQRLESPVFAAASFPSVETQRPAPEGPKSGPLTSMFASAPPVSPAPSGFQPAPASPFSASPPSPRNEPPGASIMGASPFAAFIPPQPDAAAMAKPASRPLMPPSFQAPASKPLGMPPPPAMPEGIGETVEMPLASIVKGNSPQDLGFDPNFIPAWITTKLPAYLVKQQAGAAEIKVDLGVVIDGTDESFRPIISHGKRGFMVKLPMNEVFHALPQIGGGSTLPAVASPSPFAAPEPPAPPAPIQPVGLIGLPNAFALGASNQQPPSPTQPPRSRPFHPEGPAEPAISGGWQSAAAPSPLFEPAPPPPAPPPAHQPPVAFGQEFSMPSSLPVPPMPEIASGFTAFKERSEPAQQTEQGFGFAPSQPVPPAPASRPLMGAQPFGPAAAPPPAPMPVIPQVAPPAPINVSSGAGDREQMMLRALLGVSGRLDRDSTVRQIAQLGGVEACVFVQGQQLLQHGSGSPSAIEFQRQGGELARGLRALASTIGIGEAETLSVNSDSRVVTFSFHEGAALGVLHADREPPSGLREKVALLCRELALMASA